MDSTATDSQRHSAPPFTLGVASGDPLPDSVILWTRLAPEPLAPDGAGGMDGGDHRVGWEVSVDEAFSTVVARGEATATAAHAHTVHVDATGLQPATTYWYRFRMDTHVSPVGRTRTLPDGDPDRFRLAVANCQMLDSVAYGAYRHMAEEDLDLVVHLGDYIYEYAGRGVEAGEPEPRHETTTLADYRVRYASYKTNPQLKDVHGRFAFALTWDDHEVADNYAGNTLPVATAPDVVSARRAIAYQAWWEHLPVRLDPPQGDRLDIHRAFTIGSLARIHLLDERQHADVPPCRTPDGHNFDVGWCAEITDPRTLLGAEQEQWIAESLAIGGVRWNLLANPVVLGGIDTGTDSPVHYLETWDGYPQARARLIAALASSDNPVVLTGDYHTGMVLDVHEKPFDIATAVIAPEFMSPPISSLLFPDDVSARTPQMRQQINGHGYITVDVTPDQVAVAFRLIEDVSDPSTAISTASTWLVDHGDPVTRPA